MSEKGFEPLTSQLGISGTSYRLQLGLINDKWASRILKGKNILDSFVYKDEDVVGDVPNQNLIVGWVLRTVAIPNINPHQIMKTTNVLVKQAVEKKKQRKVVAPVSETKKVELEKVPESEIKRPQAKGWVKEEAQVSEADKRKAFQERMKAKKVEVAHSQPEKAASSEESTPSAPSKSAQSSSVNTVKTSRKLPSIPGGGSSGGAESSQEKASGGSTTPAGASSFCPSCGKDLTWKFCPYCGKPLPQE